MSNSNNTKTFLGDMGATVSFTCPICGESQKLKSIFIQSPNQCDNCFAALKEIILEHRKKIKQ